jgi:glycosyltransferase involved in cell wall biosynthesis
MTLISVLIPLRNGVEFLHDSVASVTAQTHSHWEIIIGVNGHSQVSRAMRQATECADRDSRIRAVHLPNIDSKSSALNIMARVADSDWLCLLDVDDVWTPTKLERQVPYVGCYGVIGTLAEYFGDTVGNIPVLSGEFGFEELMLTNHVVNSSAMLHKRDAVWEELELEDYAMWLRLAHSGRGFFNVPEVLVRHRIHKASAFNTRQFDVEGLRRRWRDTM